MNRLGFAACAAGTMLAAAAPPAFADAWQPTSGSVTIDAVNPCTGESTDVTLVWSESLTTATTSGTLRTSTIGAYSATDGSSGTVRTTWGTSPTKDGYADSYRQVLVGEYDGRAQHLTFVFRVVVGEDSDVKVDRRAASCGSA